VWMRLRSDDHKPDWKLKAARTRGRRVENTDDGPEWHHKNIVLGLRYINITLYGYSVHLIL
jgi:hypothetical protein